MGKGLLLVLVCITFLSCRSVKKYNAQINSSHDIESLKKDVDKIYNQLKKHHPKLYQYISKNDLDFKIDSLKNSIQIPLNSREFYKKIAPIISSIRQGHISVGSANRKFTNKENKVLKKKKFEFYNLDFEYLNNKLWIVSARGKDSILIGSEVVKLGSDSSQYLVNIFKKRFSSDGFNKTMYNRAIGRYFSSFYYKDKGFQNSLNITLKNNDSTFVKALKRISKKDKKKDSVNILKPKKLTLNEKVIKKRAKKNRKKEKRRRGYITKTKEYTRNFNFKGEDGTIAYMKLRSFTNGKFRKFYKESFVKIDSAKSKVLIVDLRDNGGGRISEIDYLYSYLTNKDYKFMEPSEVNSRLPFFKYLMSNTTPMSLKIASGILSPLIATQNLLRTKKNGNKFYYRFKYSNVRKPKSLNFTGKIYVLINGNSFSASSLISTHLKENKNVVFVGEETGGAYNGCVAGIYKIYELPTSKLKVRMGLMQIEAPYKQIPDGYGIKPNVQVFPTLEDRILKKDPELDWVFQDIYSTMSNIRF